MQALFRKIALFGALLLAAASVSLLPSFAPPKADATREEAGVTLQYKAEYTVDSNGTLRVVNSGERDGERREAIGVARFKGERTVGELEVSFFRPFYGDYRIIRLAPDYRYAVATSGTMEYLWILARTPQLPETEKKELIEYA